MSQGLWFYATDSVEKGPVSLAELKALAASGQLRPDSLVWQEGMPNWQTAKEVSAVAGLFSKRFSPPAPPVTASPPAPPVLPSAPSGSTPLNITPSPSPPRLARRLAIPLNFEPLQFCKGIGQPLMLLGLVLVLTSKGCDAINNRYAARLRAIAESSEAQFNDTFELTRIRLEKSLKTAREKKDDKDKDKTIKDLQEDLDKSRKKREETREEKETGEWRDQKIAARDAASSNQQWGYFNEMAFVLGTIVLSVGLLVIGFTGQGAERWICFIMLAIVTFSVYVGGTAWLASIMSSVPR